MDDQVGTIRYARFDQEAPGRVWSGVADVYVLGFAAPPYREPSAELRRIEQWGPDMLRGAGGRLTVATHQERVIGFAISEGLASSESWQRLLQSAPLHVEEPELSPEDAVVIEELAVDGDFRGQGIARGLVRLLLQDRPERHAVLSAYGRATSVRAMYERWGFDEFGTAPAEDSDDTLHLMHHRLPWPG